MPSAGRILGIQPNRSRARWILATKTRWSPGRQLSHVTGTGWPIKEVSNGSNSVQMVMVLSGPPPKLIACPFISSIFSVFLVTGISGDTTKLKIQFSGTVRTIVAESTGTVLPSIWTGTDRGRTSASHCRASTFGTAPQSFDQR